MKLKKILVMAMAFAMLVPSFAFANDCGTGIGSNGVENQLGSLKIIKESN